MKAKRLTISTRFTSLLLASLIISPAWGHIVDNPDSVACEALMRNAPSEFFAPPKLTLPSKSGKFIFAAGGYVKATASLDFGNPIDNPSLFTSADIPLHNPPGDGAKVNFSAMTSTLWVNAIANPGDKQVGAFAGFNFLGEDYLPKLIYAYVRYNGFQAGYDYTLFSDPGCPPAIIDYEGPGAYLAVGTVGLRYNRSFGHKKEWEAGASVELPQASYTPGMRSGVVSQRVPDIPAYIRYQWGGGASWVRLAAIYRNIAYRDLRAGKNRYPSGWGLSFTGGVAIVPSLTLTWQASGGKGMTSYYQETSGMGLDLLPDPAHDGRLKAVPSWGAFAGVSWQLSDRVMAAASYGQMRIYADAFATEAETPYADTFRYSQYASASLFYDILPALQCGLEYNWGRLSDMSRLSAHNNRLQTMLRFNF